MKKTIQVILATIMAVSLSACGGTDKGGSTQGTTVTKKTDLQEWWGGDWYGWWTTRSGEGWLSGDDMNGMSWDCLATMDVDEKGNGNFVLWDEVLSKDDPMAEIKFTISKDSGSGKMGAAISESGYYIDMDIKHADIIIDPSLCKYENFMIINLTYEDDEGSSEMEVYLRPWGQDWSDVSGTDSGMPYEDMMPYYYDDWYLPAIKAGKDMPDTVGTDDGETTPTDEPENSEEPTENPSTVNGITPIGDEETIGVVLPAGFAFNEGWYCYSDSAYTVALWLSDTKTYTEQSEMQTIMDQYPNGKKETIGSYSVYVAEDPNAYEGATTKYFVELNGLAGFYGCMVKVSSTQNDMSATQTDAIKQMIASIQTVN